MVVVVLIMMMMIFMNLDVYSETLLAVRFWLRDLFEEAVPDICRSVFDLQDNLDVLKFSKHT
jgi:hypothetical protein